MAELAFRLDLAAPRERVFASLTEARHLERWFCERAESEARLAGRLVMHWSGPEASAEPFVGRWVQFDPHEACAWQGGHSGYPGGDSGTVLFELVALSEGTQLRVRHTFPDDAAFEPFIGTYREAWPRALRRLTEYLTPQGAPS